MTVPEPIEVPLPDPAALDDPTCADLEIDALATRIGGTITAPGAVLLGEVLRKPLTAPADFAARAAHLSALEDDHPRRNTLRATLEKLGRSSYPKGLASWVRDPLPVEPDGMLLHRFLALALATALVLSIVRGGGAWIVFGGLFLVNMSVHYQTRRGIELHLDTLRELGRLIRCGGRLARLDWPEFQDVLEPLGRRAEELTGLRRATGMLLPSGGGLSDALTGIGDYISIAFLVETRAYARVLRKVRAQRQQLVELFDGVGLLDALQAASLYRERMPIRCTPEIVEGRVTLETTDLVHPMLDEAVPNSLSLTERGCFITGSNMSGKSTFLRAVGLNVVLAQTLCVATASSLAMSPFRVITSLTTSDDLAHGRSFYFAEAERLLRMVEATKAPGPVLCIIDELLRGTNSIERIAAGRQILAWLAARETLVMVATHDMELLEGLADSYDGYHFSDASDADALDFDHRLRPGTLIHRNALRLLEHLGFPAEIVEGARAAVRAADPASAPPSPRSRAPTSGA